MARQFNELIGTNLFDVNFKNSIRDYYTYGFKSYSDFERSKSTLNQDWNTLSKILGEKWKFEKGKYGRNRVVLRTSERSMENPMDELYFFHKLTYIEGFLNYLLELSPDARLRRGLASIPSTEEVLTDAGNLQNINEVEYAIIDNWLKALEGEAAEKTDRISSKSGLAYELKKQKIQRKRISDYPVRINRQLNAFSDVRYKRTKDRNAEIRLRMKILEELGIVCNLSSVGRTEWRNRWLAQQWELYQAETSRSFKSHKTKYSPDYWMGSKLTMESLIDFIRTESGTDKVQEITEQLHDLFAFYAQYYPLGEIGTFLNQRLAGQVRTDEIKMYRFKHNYLMKTLYDYNLLDFLTAIEQKLICKLIYVHGIRRKRMEKIVVPLQIRISSVNGREHILCYDLEEKRISAFRLEFVDEVILYETVSAIWEKSDEVQDDTEINILDPRELDEKLQLAKEMLAYIWGTDIGGCEVKHTWKDNLVRYCFRIRYKTEEESYIKERIRKECRGHKIQVEQSENGISIAIVRITCFPTRELRNWARSFYGRIESVQKLEEDTFHLKEDVKKLWKIYYEGRDCDTSRRIEVQNEEKKTVPALDRYYRVEGSVVSELKTHGALFHEIFSKYAVVLADSILVCSGQVSGNLEKELYGRVEKTLGYYSSREIQTTVDKLMERAQNMGLQQQDGEMRYVTEKTDYLGQVLPFTKLECRWMLAVLQDPMAEAFLTEELINKMAGFIQTQSFCPDAAFPFGERKTGCSNAVFYYDRFLNTKRNRQQIQWLRETGRAIRQGQRIWIDHRDWRGYLLSDICIRPVWIEYSGRDDEIRIWGLDEAIGKVRIINLSRVEALSVKSQLKDEGTDGNLEEKPDITRSIQAQKNADMLLQQSMTSIRVEFYEGVRNLPDRILTEFSQWKKQCIYDPETERYGMTFTYSIYDEREILIRLLGYGPYIKVDSENPDNMICRELKMRIHRQMEIMNNEQTVN